MITGKEKREQMAVMETAISSSLSHPNLVQVRVGSFCFFGCSCQWKHTARSLGYGEGQVQLLGCVSAGVLSYMTGKGKREKMAVMETAISSSLSHPNVVQVRVVYDSVSV
jgi:hypothetical protein